MSLQNKLAEKLPLVLQDMSPPKTTLELPIISTISEAMEFAHTVFSHLHKWGFYIDGLNQARFGELRLCQLCDEPITMHNRVMDITVPEIIRTTTCVHCLKRTLRPTTPHKPKRGRLPQHTCPLPPEMIKARRSKHGSNKNHNRPSEPSTNLPNDFCRRTNLDDC